MSLRSSPNRLGSSRQMLAGQFSDEETDKRLLRTWPKYVGRGKRDDALNRRVRSQAPPGAYFSPSLDPKALLAHRTRTRTTLSPGVR